MLPYVKKIAVGRLLENVLFRPSLRKRMQWDNANFPSFIWQNVIEMFSKRCPNFSPINFVGDEI